MFVCLSQICPSTAATFLHNVGNLGELLLGCAAAAAVIAGWTLADTDGAVPAPLQNTLGLRYFGRQLVLNTMFARSSTLRM